MLKFIVYVFRAKRLGEYGIYYDLLQWNECYAIINFKAESITLLVQNFFLERAMRKRIYLK